MKSFIAMMSAGLLVGSGWLMAAEPTVELDADEAVRLIAMAEEIRPQPITVVSIVEGVRQCEKFQESHVRRVSVIRPMSEGGSQVRRSGWYDFSWSEDYGWFLQQPVENRGGDQIRIVSQVKGELFLK